MLWESSQHSPCCCRLRQILGGCCDDYLRILDEGPGIIILESLLHEYSFTWCYGGSVPSCRFVCLFYQTWEVVGEEVGVEPSHVTNGDGHTAVE